ncbi:MAG: endonuclease/exonuclease/phosphatase family protein [Verrucomicrobiota bacterium]|nr:endonuclease/exonuclease/phosphatase family protein [Verrucomicrobiota bacterium]
MDRPLRIMTYNVHSCIGTDRQLSPLRIAEVIARCEPDIVALQELDLARARTGLIDQARLIAGHLKMSFHFHPALRVKEEQYGDAIISKWPLRVCRAAALPTIVARAPLEPRGALWVAAAVAGRELQIINTHLGLQRAERLAQVEALLGPEWLGCLDCPAPRILCGDFNALPGSGVHRRISTLLRDAARAPGSPRPRKTFPSWYPLLRLDYVFISEGLQVHRVEAPRSALTRVASDHLPLVVDLTLS